MKKIIGITTNFDSFSEEFGSIYLLSKRYIDALVSDYADIILIPQIFSGIETYINMIDGLIIPGSRADVPPKRYGEEILHDSVHIDKGRTDFDMEIILQFEKLNKPILGICGGMQMMNVVFGGSLYQDIKAMLNTEIDHNQKDSFHMINIKNDTILKTIVNTEHFIVNTIHHQSIKKIANEFVTNAISTDNIIEGIEKINHKFCLGLQWHPEYMNTEFDKKIFSSFIGAVLD